MKNIRRLQIYRILSFLSILVFVSGCSQISIRKTVGDLPPVTAFGDAPRDPSGLFKRKTVSGEQEKNSSEREVGTVCPKDKDPDWEKKLVIDQLSVGQGDSAIIRTPSGTTILIDGAYTGEDKKNIWPAIQKCWIAAGDPFFAVDYIVVTHPHVDHYAGLAGLLKAKRIKVRRAVYVPQMEVAKGDGHSVWDEFLELIPTAGVEDAKAKPAKVINLGDREILDSGKDVTFTVFVSNGMRLDQNGGVVPVKHHDPKLAKKGEFEALHKDGLPREGNAISVGMVIQYGKFSFLTAGDLTIEMEDEIAKSKILNPVDVYKSSHHGSSTANGKPFMSSIDPKYVLISVGVGGINGDVEKNKDNPKKHKFGYRLPNRSVFDVMLESKKLDQILQTSRGETQKNPLKNNFEPFFPAQESAYQDRVKDLNSDIVVITNGNEYTIDGYKPEHHWNSVAGDSSR